MRARLSFRHQLLSQNLPRALRFYQRKTCSFFFKSEKQASFKIDYHKMFTLSYLTVLRHQVIPRFFRPYVIFSSVRMFPGHSNSFHKCKYYCFSKGLTSNYRMCIFNNSYISYSVTRPRPLCRKSCGGHDIGINIVYHVKATETPIYTF